MNVSNIFDNILSAAGANAKKAILAENSKNDTFKKAIKYGMDPFTPFNVVKVPSVKSRLEFPLCESIAWEEFFTILDECSSRSITGNTAIERVYTLFSSVKKEDEVWMRKILKKHLAIGASIKTVNKVFPGLVPTFEVSLAHKFDFKRIQNRESVAVEPKLDGIRCFSIVKGDDVKMFARSGKLILNFQNTLAPELAKLGDGCYDGELMGQDFISLMRQAYRKDDVDTSGTYLSIFDFLSIDEWETKDSKMTCDERYEELLDRMADSNVNLNLIQPTYREIVESLHQSIIDQHNIYAAEGYEGAMIKFLDAPYKFGRGYEVMKMKVFHDVDLPIDSLIEGTGKHTGKLGSVKVVFNGVEVQVGSGFSDELRDAIWNDPDSFTGRIIEIRYQEVTPDGSLRFPTFVCFRNDR
jgi:DNA ligase 1